MVEVKKGTGFQHNCSGCEKFRMIEISTTNEKIPVCLFKNRQTKPEDRCLQWVPNAMMAFDGKFNKEENISHICANCDWSGPLDNTEDLYFCNFRGCACSPDNTCHAFKNKEENNNGK